MKFFGLVWKNAWRKKIRTSLTILSVLVAFLMYILLSAIGSAMTGGGGGIESARRLVVIDKVSLINLLPVSYYNKLDATPGVRVATPGFDPPERHLASTTFCWLPPDREETASSTRPILICS